MTRCPSYQDLKLVQATYFDNGKPVYPVRQNKASGGKGKNMPQHMVTLTCWTDDDLDLTHPKVSTNIILIEHQKFPRRMGSLLAKGSISQDYHDALMDLHADNDCDAFMSARTYYGPLFERGAGQSYIEGQFLTMLIEGGEVHSGKLFLMDGNGSVDVASLSKWAVTYPNGVPLKGAAKGMCRLDLCDWSPSWRTCT